MTHRFFLPPEQITPLEVQFPAEAAHQIQRVLRLSPGDSVVVLDNQGMQYEVQLELDSKRQVRGKVITSAPAPAEPRIQLSLLLPLTQREKFEWILQKCTELGASSFLPILTERSLVQTRQDHPHKYQRWESILREASEQCERGRIPRLLPVRSLAETLDKIAQHLSNEKTAAFVCFEDERQISLREALENINPISISEVFLLIGPEGGFTLNEINLAQAAGFQSISLGARILRMETAAIAATTLILNHFGEMEGKPSQRGD